MARWTLIIFTALTLLAAALTYYNVGLEETSYDSSSVRSGSAGAFYGGGGYRHGK